LTVGSRDKSFKMFDTSTYINIKTFQTEGWVTSISWAPNADMDDCGVNEGCDDTVAIRTESTCISILNLAPTCVTGTRMTSRHGSYSSISWSRDGRFVARAWGSSIIIADSLDDFRDVVKHDLRGVVTGIACCCAPQSDDLVAVIDSTGFLSILRMNTRASKLELETIQSTMVEPQLKTVSWASDGSFLATGGREHLLYTFTVPDLEPLQKPFEMGSRIWGIDFVESGATGKHSESNFLMAVALGDYSVVVFDNAFDPFLQVNRLRTARCLSFHPSTSFLHLAVGDGAGTVAIIDVNNEEMVCEFNVSGRVNVVTYSPIGDYLLVGTDDCAFALHETSSYRCLQKIKCTGFALSGAFSPLGTHLSLGSESESYSLVRLGPFLSIDLVPLNTEEELEKLPRWAVTESLYRSGYCPSLVQRYMISGGSDNLHQVAVFLRKYPDSIYAFDRKTGEGCFDTALRLKRPNLLKLAVTALIDGTLEKGGKRSILTTDLPQRGRDSLIGIIEQHSPDYIVNILDEMAFTKVPFAEQYSIDAQSRRRLECGSPSFMDPWQDRLAAHRHLKSIKRIHTTDKQQDRSRISLCPAVLPLPGLGTLEFLSALLSNAPAHAFDNDAMALVLSVMWRNHIRKWFLLDCILFSAYFSCWVALLEFTVPGTGTSHAAVTSLSLVTISLNSLYLMKEIIQSAFGQRQQYFKSLWNWADVLSIFSVYSYVLTYYFGIITNTIPLAVVTTLLLTVKLLSYLRGFSDTGWLISVLIANFRDVRGFLVILIVILVGFAVSFRLLFGGTIDSGFETLRMAFLSTFELTILGSYDSSIIYDATFSVLAALTFILAVTCVLVVALNALISILADSYAKVQENSVANRRREQASLIEEYMMLLPHVYLRRVEEKTKWFHILTETDSEGDLQVHSEGWQGGVNAMRRELEEMEERMRASREKTETDILVFKQEVMSLLKDVSEDVRKLHELHAERKVVFSGKNVEKAVKAVQSIRQRGGGLFRHNTAKES